MGTSDTPPSHRVRSKAPDFSELFRSAHGSRHSSRAGAGTVSTPSLIPSVGEKPAGVKAPSRRSMLPFLGRKKPAVEQATVSTSPTSRKSVGNAAYQVTTVNTVRRSFGNGHAVLMITPSSGAAAEPPLSSKLPSVDIHSSSLGSKLAAHFTPLRSPTTKPKAHGSAARKSAPPTPPLPSPSALSPPTFGPRAPSIESQRSRSSMLSRSTTPRPLRGPPSPATENGDVEDFSDLFTLPDPLKRLQQAQKSLSSTSVHIYPEDSPRKSGELTPTTPITPTGQPLQFPIPPPMVAPSPRSILTQKGLSPRSSDLISLSSSHRSRSPSKIPSPVPIDSCSSRTRYSDMSSFQDARSSRYRATSVSGSDTDTSRANDSSYSASSLSLRPVKSSLKPKLLAPGATKTSSGPPPTFPLPSPPLSPNLLGSGPRSAPNGSPNRVAFPRPRANTLSVTSNLTVPSRTLPKSNYSSPVPSTKVNSDVAPGTTFEELRETLSQQSRKNAQLQEYIFTITKRYEDDRMAMTRTIEKLERNIRKKIREIEGLRWLVIHNGAVSDIDAAASLARASFSTQEGDTFDGIRRPSQVQPRSMVSPQQDGLPHQSRSGQRGVGVSASATSTTPEIRSEASSSAAPFSMSSETTPMTTPSLSVIPERTDGITRAERQRQKEERRASKALRRISTASSFALGPDPLAHSSPAEDQVDPNFDPKQSMDEVMEKLQPFRDT